MGQKASSYARLVAGERRRAGQQGDGDGHGRGVQLQWDTLWRHVSHEDWPAIGKQALSKQSRAHWI